MSSAESHVMKWTTPSVNTMRYYPDCRECQIERNRCNQLALTMALRKMLMVEIADPTPATFNCSRKENQE
jgi:hypothetical protein